MVLGKEDTIEIEEVKSKQKLEFLNRQEEISVKEHDRKMIRLTKIENIALLQKFDLRTGE